MQKHIDNALQEVQQNFAAIDGSVKHGKNVSMSLVPGLNYSGFLKHSGSWRACQRLDMTVAPFGMV